MPFLSGECRVSAAAVGFASRYGGERNIMLFQPLGKVAGVVGAVPSPPDIGGCAVQIFGRRGLYLGPVCFRWRYSRSPERSGPFSRIFRV
jgi:hypothetical protein